MHKYWGGGGVGEVSFTLALTTPYCLCPRNNPDLGIVDNTDCVRFASTNVRSVHGRTSNQCFFHISSSAEGQFHRD